MAQEHDFFQSASVTIEFYIRVRIAGTVMTVSSDFGTLSREMDPDIPMNEIADEIGQQIISEYLAKSELMPS